MDKPTRTYTQASCIECGEIFYKLRSDAKYCSNRCKSKAFRKEQRFLIELGRAAAEEVNERLARNSRNTS